MRTKHLKRFGSFVLLSLIASNVYAGELDGMLEFVLLLLSIILFAVVTTIILITVFRKDRQFVKLTLCNLMAFLAILFFFVLGYEDMNIELPPIIIKLILFSPLIVQIFIIKKAIDRWVKRKEESEKKVSNEEK